MSKFLQIDGCDAVVNTEEILSVRRVVKTIIIVFKSGDDTHISLEYANEDRAKDIFKSLARSLYRY